ncbi:MAG: CBS domain-containing protein [Pseudobdellovibrio sp.]
MAPIFNSNMICIKAGSTMKAAKQLMDENRIRHLPVISDENKIVAMLSKHDLTDVQKFQDLPIDLFANYPVSFVTIDTPLSTVATKMIEEKISSLVLCDSEKNAIGIITSDDLLFQFSQMLKEKENTSSITKIDILTTAGEFFKKLADIGI